LNGNSSKGDPIVFTFDIALIIAAFITAGATITAGFLTGGGLIAASLLSNGIVAAFVTGSSTIIAYTIAGLFGLVPTFLHYTLPVKQ
jgi:hypothetical protein